jgi:ParB family transcriptional regulator, chromosome partitioning protein
METVSIADIKPNPFQARQTIDPQRIRELAEEIKETGFWPSGMRARHVNAHYELVFGHRRLEALKLLGRKTVELEVVDLDDAGMATQALVENLQREGLTDIEKANGIKHLLNVFSIPNKTKKVAELLGFSEQTILQLGRIAELDEETKQQAEAAKLSRTTIDTARMIAGPEFVRAAAKQKISSLTLNQIRAEVAKLKEGPRRKIVEQLKAGKLTKPEQVKRAARKLAAQAAVKAKKPPDDMNDILFRWTGQIQVWREQLQQMAPYRDYMDTEPYVAKKFREQAAGLIEDLQRLL